MRLPLKPDRTGVCFPLPAAADGDGDDACVLVQVLHLPFLDDEPKANSLPALPSCFYDSHLQWTPPWPLLHKLLPLQ